MKSTIAIPISFIVICVFFFQQISADTPNATYLGQYPKDRSNGWSNKLQGVGHDQGNWFFTQAKYLWKFPVDFDLNRFVESPLPIGVMKARIPEELKDLGYNHLGDLVHHRGYLLIPLEASKYLKKTGLTTTVIDNSNKPLMAVYRAADLRFVGSAPLSEQVRAGWLAINPIDGRLYTSENKMNSQNRLISYQIDFAALNRNEVDLEFINMKQLYDEHGRAITLKPYMQGGEFSDDGKFLFLVNGNQSGETSPSDGGIWIFDFRTAKKVLKSTGSMPFRFEYHPGLPNLEEPEGMTYWNLGEGDAPKIGGNLHVILFNHDVTSNDSFWFKHYQIIDVKTLPPSCNSDSIGTCNKHSAKCMVVQTPSGLATDVCHWPTKTTTVACNSAQGIWTTPDSKYAKNHPNVMPIGSNGVCASEVKNLRNLEPAAAPSCNSDSIGTCNKHSAKCIVVHTISGLATDVCHWPTKTTTAACNSAQGIWTTPDSKYAKNHPDVMPIGSNGVCASEVKNL